MLKLLNSIKYSFLPSIVVSSTTLSMLSLCVSFSYLGLNMHIHMPCVCWCLNLLNIMK